MTFSVEGFGSSNTAKEDVRVPSMRTTTTPSTACSRIAMPKVARGFFRQAWNAPSRISPRPSGRSGMTPGFGGAWYRPPGKGG
ncbi:hypothetical protein AC792_05395 [Arthrobacter sp. RIT-PI-e]|uniref:hypothetical protein n=1 Tax=Arthrobacter sp. RIT-PI-e TaxID=1681197 RepID=UPI000675D35A|nr:hypothetical protein [Arthrobacter sp. RIT-PI-e]KNC19539.1 hypothetical protein AC792_05395 [Arthrobacter sp. RIT-PI-e]